ncbi:MAG: sigma-70 family RNA polymerase sigma factor [Thermomicrobiales bacterium]
MVGVDANARIALPLSGTRATASGTAGTDPGMHGLVADTPSRQDTPDDLVIMTRAQQDPKAFAPLYEYYEPIVRGYCQRRLGNPEVAADATSRIFIRALGALPDFRPDPSRPGNTFRSWLFTIAHNVVVDVHRRNRKHPSLDQPGRDGVPLGESATAIDPSASPEDIALANDLGRQLRDALAHLPERQRQIVELRLAGLTGAEIAESLGMSLSAVKSAQFRAYATMRTLLDRQSPSSSSPEEASHAS